MPNIPDRTALGRIQVAGADRPTEVNPMVAYDIGRAGEAWNRAMSEVERGFGQLAAKKKKADDDSWLSERKLDTLKQEDELRRGTEMEAGEDGTGYEAIPQKYKGIVEGNEAVAGGSDEARAKYKEWSSERAFETGRWGVHNSQARAKDFNLKQLDRRLDEITNLTATNPAMGGEYFKAYEEEVRSKVGTSIDAPSAALRIERARQNVLKVGVVEKAKKNPMDYARALKALDEAGYSSKSQDRLPQASGASRDDAIGRAARASGVPESTMRMFARIESGNNPNAKTGSYSGLFQLSEDEFKKYGGTPGKILDPEENAAAAGRKLKAEMDRFRERNGREASDLDLYLVHQQGEAGSAAHMRNPDAPAWKNMAGTGEGRRKGAAWAKQAIWGNIPDDVKAQFPGGVESVTSRQFIGVWADKQARLGGEQVKAPSQAISQGVRLRDLPAVAGSIQPAELMSLRPEDFHAVTTQLKPYLATEMEQRVKDAGAALLASGNQSVFTDEDAKLAPLVAGPKVAEKWKDSLDEARDLHNIYSSAKQLTGAERRQHIAAIRPDEDSGMQSEDVKKHYERWVSVDAEMTKAMKANPVEFFATQNESGKAAISQVANAPEGNAGLAQREQAYEVLLKLQRDEGLDQKDITLLSKDSAEKVVNGIMSAKSGQAAIAQVDQLRSQYGRHFNTVWGQLTRAGAPASFLAMPTATTKGQNALVDTVILEKSLADSAGKDADRKSLLRQRAGVSEKDLANAVNSEISDLVGAIDPSSFGLNESYRQAVEKVTLYHMIANGKGLADAGRAAAADVFKENLSVYSGVIIPNAEYGSPGQRANLRLGLTNGHKAIRAASEQIIVPLASSGYTTRAYDKGRYIERLAADKHFVTSNDAKGVHLLDHDNRRVMISTADGPKPLFLSWEQLRGVGLSQTEPSINRLFN